MFDFHRSALKIENGSFYRLHLFQQYCFKNKFKLLIDKGLKRKDPDEFCDLSSLMMDKLSKNEYV